MNMPAGRAAPLPAPGPPAAAVPPALLLECRLRGRHRALPADDNRLPLPSVMSLGTSDVLSDSYAEALRRSTANVQVSTRTVLIGPFAGADKADRTQARGCGHCLAMRWQRLRPRPHRDALETGAPGPEFSSWPVLPAYLVDALWWAYQGAHAASIGGAPFAQGLGAGGDTAPALPSVVAFDLETLRVQQFPLMGEPLCPACAASGPDCDSAWEPLLSRSRSGSDDDRLRSPASYRLPVTALANPVCGVIGAGYERNVTSPTTAPVAGSFDNRGYTGLKNVVWGGQANSFRHSRDLAFLEGLERYAGTQRRRCGGTVMASLDDLGSAGLDPRDCGVYAPDTYRDDPVLQPFSPQSRIPWLPGYSLRDQRPILVPARLCHYGMSTEADSFVFECSNGCATGSCLEEAILFGLLELVERDSFLLGWYGGAPLTAIDLADTGPGQLRAMIDRAALLGYHVAAFDNRIDLAIPVVTAVAVRADGGEGMIAFGAGAGLHAESALEAAVAEAMTYIPHLPKQTRERRGELRAMAGDFSRVVELRDHAQLFGLPEMAGHASRYLEPERTAPRAEIYADGRQERSRADDLLDDLRFCQDELVRIGCDVIVVDQTTPEQAILGLRTVRTLAPGLLPMDFGWTRQRALRMPRLRSALHTAGLRERNLTDDDLHLVPHPFP